MVLLTVFVGCSLLLHAIQIDHRHVNTEHTHKGTHETSESTHSILKEYMHVSDKKWLYMIFTISLYGYIDLLVSRLDQLLSSMFRFCKMVLRQSCLLYRYLYFLRLFFQRGITHSKVH